MSKIADEADDIFRRRVLRARQMSPADKLLAGPRLFDLACQRMTAGIKAQFPEATEAEVQAELRRRLAIARQLENQRDESFGGCADHGTCSGR